jgi:nucleoid DNA-binding protein
MVSNLVLRGFTKELAELAVDETVALMRRSLRDGKSVSLKNTCTLIPKLRSAGTKKAFGKTLDVSEAMTIKVRTSKNFDPTEGKPTEDDGKSTVGELLSNPELVKQLDKLK